MDLRMVKEVVTNAALEAITQLMESMFRIIFGGVFS
jgi:hypothetical protein